MLIFGSLLLQAFQFAGNFLSKGGGKKSSNGSSHMIKGKPYEILTKICRAYGGTSKSQNRILFFDLLRSKFINCLSYTRPISTESIVTMKIKCIDTKVCIDINDLQILRKYF